MKHFKGKYEPHRQVCGQPQLRNNKEACVHEHEVKKQVYSQLLEHFNQIIVFQPFVAALPLQSY